MSAERLKEELVRIGMTIEQLSEQLHVPTETLTEFNETMLITVETLQELAATKLDILYIFTGVRYDQNLVSPDSRIAKLTETSQNLILSLIQELEEKAERKKQMGGATPEKQPQPDSVTQPLIYPNHPDNSKSQE